MLKNCTVKSGAQFLVSRLFLIALFALGTTALFAQTDNETASVSAPEPVEKSQPAAAGPAVSDLRGVSIGMTIDEVKSKLGKPDTSDASGMYYTFDNGESMQLALDPQKTVTMIAEMYSGKDAKAPQPTDIFGPDGEIQPAADGKLYKMMRYPTSGLRISYSRLNLDAGPLTTVTIQKMYSPR